MAFLTEKKTDALLEIETRMLTLENGEVRKVSMMRVYWNSLDYVVPRLSPLDLLAEHADHAAKAHQIDFDTALAYKATVLHQWAKDMLNAEPPCEPGVCPLFYKAHSSAV